jgi:hypothetical protein
MLMLNSLLSSLVGEAILVDVLDAPTKVVDIAIDWNPQNASVVSHFTNPRSPCDVTTAEDCSKKYGCRWIEHRCRVRIAWLHVMKTASSFGTTLAHHANATLPKTAHIPSGKNHSDPEDMTARPEDFYDRHLVLDFFEFKYPVGSWFQDVFRHPTNPGGHVPIMEDEWTEWKGSWITVLRQPEARASSAWHHFGKGRGDVLKFQRNVQGQQARMLSSGEAAASSVLCERTGGGLFDSSAPCDISPVPNVTLAVERLRDFAFVGILEEYDMTVCLFHVMFGSECLPVEFSNSRATNYHEDEAAKERELNLLKKTPDPWDTPVYEAALERFNADLVRYGVTKSTCREVCPGGPFGEKQHG